MDLTFSSPPPRALVIGAGVAGLSAAWELSQSGDRCVVIEKDGFVGGLARTCEYKGCKYDIGGHRFYTKIDFIDRIWHELLGNDFLTRPRLSRIYYRSKFYQYPLDPLNAARNLGAIETLRCVLSYMRARVAPVAPETSFETWVSNRFGRRLFQSFFKAYTEKVWGIPCSEIDAAWAAQRIKGLSVRAVLEKATGLGGGKAAVKSLIHEFKYPRLGPGMMWERMAEQIVSRGSSIALNTPVQKIRWNSQGIVSVEAGGRTWTADHYISSMPIRDLLLSLDPQPAEAIRRAADDFNYRDFLTVVLIVRGRNLFPDNWIYVHDTSVQVGRIQNYTNWSPEMTPDPSVSCLGLEYFCNEGGSLWARSDEDLLKLGRAEIEQLGLVPPGAVVDGVVLRVPKAYPVYDRTYRQGLATVREFTGSLPNLQLIGRNGMHHYNNQDHSMLTGILAARNVQGASHDLWQVNEDPEYLEGSTEHAASSYGSLASTQPRVPRSLVHTGEP